MGVVGVVVVWLYKEKRGARKVLYDQRLCCIVVVWVCDRRLSVRGKGLLWCGVAVAVAWRDVFQKLSLKLSF